MKAKRKAKFRVGQVVWYRGRHGDTLQKLSARKYFLEDPGWGYQFEDSLDAGFREEEKLRPLTRREKRYGGTGWEKEVPVATVRWHRNRWKKNNEAAENLAAEVTQYAERKGEAWRVGEGTEIMDALTAYHFRYSCSR